MESIILSAAQNFNLKCTRSKIYKDKFGYVCVTAQGPVRIQRASDRASRARGRNANSDETIAAIMFQHAIKEHLHESGFAVDRFLFSSQNAPYFKTDGSDGDVYTACFVQTGANIDFTKGNALLDTAGHIAKMHHTLSEANIAPVSAMSAMSAKEAKSGDNGAKLLESLTILKKKLLKAGKFSDFDILFLRGYEKLAPHIAAIDDSGSCAKHICHNLLKEENIYRQENDGTIAITNFSEAARLHHLYDLAYIIKRYIKAKPQEIMPIDKILEAYGSGWQKPLDDALFRRILLYPDKFIKVTTDYYSKKRSFAPNTYISRMQECLRAGEILSENL